MTTVKCDFCGGEIKGEHADRLVLTLDRRQIDGTPIFYQPVLLKAFDLCAACMEEVWKGRDSVFVTAKPPFKTP